MLHMYQCAQNTQCMSCRVVVLCNIASDCIWGKELWPEEERRYEEEDGCEEGRGIESDEGRGIHGKRYVRGDLSGRVITPSLGRGSSGKSSPKKGTILSA